MWWRMRESSSNECGAGPSLSDFTPTVVPVLDAAQAAAWDERARHDGVPSRVLMESAGRAAAHVIARDFASALRHGVLVVAGHGNNGGDGWVVARALHAAGAAVHVIERDCPRSEDCEANRALALEEGVLTGPGDGSWPHAGVVIDALLGTGASGPPRGEIGALAARIANADTTVVAIDGPTGLDLSTGDAHGPVRADLTVTFGGFRRGHLLAREWCGRVTVLDIGFTRADAEWPRFVHDAWAGAVVPGLEPSMHKGRRGHVLILGGEAGMAGAVHYAARAAHAAGAGLVRIATQPRSADALQASLPDVTVVETELAAPLEPRVSEMLDWAHAIVLGPGFGRGDDRSAFVREVLNAAQVPLIIDADALHAGRPALTTGSAPRVFTPHRGEFSAMMDLEKDEAFDPFLHAERAAAELGGRDGSTTLLLKGVPSVVASPGQASWVVGSGNPGLSTGGSGDLLSGFVGAFLARGLTTHAAAALGAQVLGRAADFAAARHTARATRPSDVLAALPVYWRSLALESAPTPPVLVELAPPTLL